MDNHGSATPAPGSPDVTPHERLSLVALAEQRGISKDAARRLVKAGKVQAHQVLGDHGPEWCVHPDETVESVDSFRHGGASPAPGLRNGSAGDPPGLHHGPATVGPAPDLAALVAVVDRLTVENRQLAEAAAVWQERARMLADQLALAAPQSPQAGSGEPDPSDPTPEPSSPFPWPLPPSPNVRTIAPWLFVLALLALTVAGLVWPR